MPPCPIAIPSSTAIVLNSRGTAPAARTASATTWPTSRRCTWPDTNSVKLLATAIIGLPRSSRATPVARSSARAPAMLRPYVTVQNLSGGMSPPGSRFLQVWKPSAYRCRGTHGGLAARRRGWRLAVQRTTPNAQPRSGGGPRLGGLVWQEVGALRPRHDISWIHGYVDSDCAGRDRAVHDPLGGDLGAALLVLDRRRGPARIRRAAPGWRHAALVPPVTAAARAC